jgi:diguanylate cyclase (GGDEF)-like protein
MYKNIIDMLNLGIVIIDRNHRIMEWNRWMEIHSGIKKPDIIGTGLFDHYPHLSSPNFTRLFKSVLTFGNIVFLSQKLHNYLFPFRTTGLYSNSFEFMQQSCSMAPARDETDSINGVIITVQDVTENVYMERSLTQMNMQDSLTGITNRRHLDKRLAEEFMRHRRYGREMSVVMLDIDNFKNINDTYGHQVGDTVLRTLAAICSEAMRAGDIISRFGGEEFCAILPETDCNRARMFAERLRQDVAAKEILHDENTVLRITISLGIAGLDETVRSPEDLVKNADEAMYNSKQKGKNMVSLHQNCK